MRRLSMAAALLAAFLGGCSLRPLKGDRLLEANRIEEAEVAYRSFLDKHQSTTRGRQALYRLGLIYSMQDSPLYDPERGQRTLQQLADHPEGGIYSRQALLVLDLQFEISRLEEAAQAQASLAARLEHRLGRMEEEVAQASSEAGEQETQARRLTGEINYLRTEIARLTKSLEEREKELQRIKEIDLGRVP